VKRRCCLVQLLTNAHGRSGTSSLHFSGFATSRDLTGFRGIIPKTMRSKRLQHLADTMCQIFCGWRLIESKPNLVDLGSGTLEIDAITGQCFFQGQIIDKLKIAEEIRAWMQDDLAANKIPIAALTGARLSVKLSFSLVPWSTHTREIFYSDAGAVLTEK
jgi:hypothetical protein